MLLRCVSSTTLASLVYCLVSTALQRSRQVGEGVPAASDAGSAEHHIRDDDSCRRNRPAPLLLRAGKGAFFLPHLPSKTQFVADVCSAYSIERAGRACGVVGGAGGAADLSLHRLPREFASARRVGVLLRARTHRPLSVLGLQESGLSACLPVLALTKSGFVSCTKRDMMQWLVGRHSQCKMC